MKERTMTVFESGAADEVFTFQPCPDPVLNVNEEPRTPPRPGLNKEGIFHLQKLK